MKTILSVSIIAVVSICSFVVIIVLARVDESRVSLTLWDGIAFITSILIVYFLNKKKLIKRAADSIEKNILR